MNKNYFFYDGKGEVYLIYTVEPPQELLENNYIVDIEAETKEGFFTEYTVDITTKKLNYNYKPIPKTDKENIKDLQNNSKLQMQGIVKNKLDNMEQQNNINNVTKTLINLKLGLIKGGK